jgi:DNA excision repair protein ERCC-3
MIGGKTLMSKRKRYEDVYASSRMPSQPPISQVKEAVPVPLTGGDIQGEGEPTLIKENMVLRPGHENRPLWVCHDGRIYFEAGLFPEISSPVNEFLVAIAEPICRPKYIHQFQITVFSLYAAISLGMSCDEILESLNKFAKNELDKRLSDYISLHGRRIGKLRLVLRRHHYYIESIDEQLIRTVEAHFKINPHKLSNIEKEEITGVFSFEVDPNSIEKVKEAAYKDLQMPLLEEFEFKGDSDLQLIPMTLRPTTNLRPYQEKSLHKMFSGRRARSGIIVLPCGAGKTLTGITAACTMKCRTMVLTTTAVAVDQWKRQFELFCAMDPMDVITLTADNKQPIPEDRPCILVSTYSMFSHSLEHMSRASSAVLQQVKDLEWGLLIVDEVQVMPARTFRQVATTVRAHCKLGLTATLVREDDLIEDLQYLIGPKLYEANWQDLEDNGYIAKVQCVEVWCEMSQLFWSAYLSTTSGFIQRSLYTANPRKLTACEYLVRLHEQRGDKIIVFCDNISLLKDMARRTKKPFICGSVSMQERMAIIRCFQHSNRINTIFLSQVGDNAIDIPNANVVIQISSHYGSRRQEAQRLGRILRPKAYRDEDGFNAYFYSLVSRDTPEKEYAERRQRFLVDQGYAFTIISNFDDRIDLRMADGEVFEYMDETVQRSLLRQCLEGTDEIEKETADVRVVDSSTNVSEEQEKRVLAQFGGTAAVSTKKSSLAALSGATSGHYR